MSGKKTRVLHIISGLGIGGAEAMLLKLLRHSDSSRFEHRVIALSDRDEMLEPIRAASEAAECLGMRFSIGLPGVLSRLRSRIVEFRPDVVQTWMYHGDVIGGLVSRWACQAPVVWNLRQSNLQVADNRFPIRLLFKLGAILSKRIPRRIVCGSYSAAEVHSRIGYDEAKMVVITNGFDLDRFAPNRAHALDVRRELGLEESQLLIGMFGRFDARKDHRSFLLAADRVHDEFPDVHFLLCGSGIDWDNERLLRSIPASGLRSVLHLLEVRHDLPRLTASLDVAVNSSIGEGLSNAVGEAMACAVPCVVTDVGDSARLVGDTGLVVGVGDHEGLAEAMISLIRMSPARRSQLGAAARGAISRNYEINAVVDRYQSLYEELAHWSLSS